MQSSHPADGALPVFVLIHGAWQGSWVFAEWLPYLEMQGCRAVAVDLPGNQWPPAADSPTNLHSYTAHVLSVLQSIEGQVILVGHSGGGITASQVAELAPERVAALVYLAGIMLPSGHTLGDIIRQCEPEFPGRNLDGISAWLQFSADGTESSVQLQGALSCFVQDCDPVKALQAAQLLRPQQETGRLMQPSLTQERFGSVPRFYVECTEDCSIVLPLQRKMQQLLPGTTTITLHCGHVPQLAQPLQLTESLLPALRNLLQ